MPDTPALEVRDLSVQRGPRAVLSRVNLTTHFSEITAVLGPNGAGKSTLLRAISGLLEYTGEVSLEGTKLRSLTSLERARRMSFVPQHSLLTAPMQVRRVVAQGRYAHRSSLARLSAADYAVVDEAMHETDVLALAERPFNELSFGEQRRVLIARALATGARVLLLDEPTAALDIEHSLRLFTLLRELAAQGRSIVVVLHQLDEALRFSDRAALIKAGQLLAYGPSRDIISKERVRELYGVELIEGGGLGFRLPEGAS